jgi:hypothetical protein
MLQWWADWIDEPDMSMLELLLELVKSAPIVITSVGSPASVLAPLHDAGALVLAEGVVEMSDATTGPGARAVKDWDIASGIFTSMRCGNRTVGLFATGNRATVLRPEEMVTALVVPKPKHEARSTFLKLGARKYLIISIVMAAVVVEIADGSAANARVAVGSCSAVAQRLPALEAALTGRPLDANLADLVQPEHLAPLSPIDDVRGTAVYRREAALTVVKRAIRGLVA